MNFEFNLKTNTKFGAGTALNLPQYLKELSLFRPGVIVDGGVSDQDYSKKILKILESDSELTVKKWIYDIRNEPDYDSLDRIKTMFLDTDGQPLSDCFVGIGGGSVMDFAKGLATIVVNPGKAIKYRGFPTNLVPSLPTIAVPTTAGTGSEVTYNAVFIDKKEKRKLGINSKNNFPVLAIIDPLLTIDCPKKVSAASGMDAMVHTLESFVARQSNPINKIFAREAFQLLYNNLPKIIEHPENLDARTKVQIGAYLAGISLINSGSGPAAALSYPLGVHFGVPHGLAGGVFITHIIEHNVSKGYDYSELYDLIEGVDRSIWPKERNAIFVKKMFELTKSLDIPDNLEILGVNSGNVDILLTETEKLEPAFAQNPIPFSIEDGKQLLKRMIKARGDVNARL